MSRRGNPNFPIRLAPKRREIWQRAADLKGCALSELIKVATDVVADSIVEGRPRVSRELAWVCNLPQSSGLYAWRSPSASALDGGPVGGLVTVVVVPTGYGWPCLDGRVRGVRGAYRPELVEGAQVAWLELSSFGDEL